MNKEKKKLIFFLVTVIAVMTNLDAIEPKNTHGESNGIKSVKRKESIAMTILLVDNFAQLPLPFENEKDDNVNTIESNVMAERSTWSTYKRTYWYRTTSALFRLEIPSAS